MALFMLWLNGHSTILLLIGALVLWVAAYYTYFRTPVSEFVRRGQKHTWKVDMEKKEATSRGKIQI